jgi:hypothetical protein
MLDGLESLDPGVLESWGIGVLKKDIKPLTIIPALQYSNTPKSFEFKPLQ